MLSNGPKHVLNIVENDFWTYYKTLRHFFLKSKYFWFDTLTEVEVVIGTTTYIQENNHYTQNMFWDI